MIESTEVQVYYKFFGFAENDFVQCEMCGRKVYSIKKVNSAEVGHIENISGLCFNCNKMAYSEKEFNEMVRYRHLKKVKANLKQGYKNLKKHGLEKWILTPIN